MVLIARRLIFKKVTIMPKGQSPKVKGAICKAKKNIALFPEDRVAKKCLTRAATKNYFFCTQMEIQIKKENKH